MAVSFSWPSVRGWRSRSCLAAHRGVLKIGGQEALTTGLLSTSFGMALAGGHERRDQASHRVRGANEFAVRLAKAVHTSQDGEELRGVPWTDPNKRAELTAIRHVAMWC